MHFTDSRCNWFYPENSELLHRAGISSTGPFSPFLTSAGSALLAAWCIGCPYGVAPPLADSRGDRHGHGPRVPREAGTPATDTVPVARCLAAAAILMERLGDTRVTTTKGGAGRGSRGSPTGPRNESRTASPVIGDRSPPGPPPACRWAQSSSRAWQWHRPWQQADHLGRRGGLRDRRPVPRPARGPGKPSGFSSQGLRLSPASGSSAISTPAAAPLDPPPRADRPAWPEPRPRGSMISPSPTTSSPTPAPGPARIPSRTCGPLWFLILGGASAGDPLGSGRPRSPAVRLAGADDRRGESPTSSPR